MSLGSIVVRLTMNTADFETDAGRAAKVAEKRSKEIDAAFRKAGNAIGVALGAAAVAVGAALKQSIDHMDSMSKAAAKVGQSTEEFSKLVYAGSLADVQMETLVSTMGKLTKAQAAALDSSSQQAKVFDALGISVKNADGSMRSSSDVLLDFADRFKQLGGSQEAIAAGFQVFGRSFQDIIPLIKDGADGLRAAGDEAERLGIVVDSEAAAAAEKFNDDLTRMQSALGGVVMEIASGMLPSLTDMTDGMVSAASETDNLRDLGEGLGIVLEGVGGFLGYVASQARQLGIDVAATIEIMRGLNEFSKFNFSGGQQMIENAIATRNAMKQEAEAAGRLAEARKSLAKTERGLTYVQYDGPLLSGLDTPKPTRLNLPTSGSGGRAAPKRSQGLSEEAKFAQELSRSYDSLNASMAERIALFGDVTELQKISYDIEHGSLKGLDAARADVLKKQAAELDAKRDAAKLDEEAKRLVEGLLEPYQRVNKERERAAELLKLGAITQEQYNASIAAHSTPAEQMLADMKFEIELLGKTREQQELLTAARYLGAEATTEAGEAAIAAMADYQRLNEQMQEQISFMDEFRGGMSDALVDLVTGAKSAKEAFADFFDDMAAKITRMIAERWIEQLFGKQSSSGGGTQGGDWIGMIFQGLFGGARASGGPVDANKAYLVGERGPELIVPRTAGLVLNAQQTAAASAGSGSGFNQVNQFHFAAPTDPRTQIQVAARIGFETRRAQRRN